MTDDADAARDVVAPRRLRPFRAFGRSLGLLGLVVLGLAIHRAQLWRPVAVAFVLAGSLLGLLRLLRAGASGLLERRRLSGRSLAELDRMPGDAFEDWVVSALTRAGFTCENLPRTRDYGIDVIAAHGAQRVGVQVKRYDGAVGNAAVQQAIAGAGHHDCAIAAVVTQSRFTAAARAQAASARVPVVLIDRATLPQMARLLRRVRRA